MPGLFTKADGTRLNLAAVTCQRIDIHATVNVSVAPEKGAILAVRKGPVEGYAMDHLAPQ